MQLKAQQNIKHGHLETIANGVQDTDFKNLSEKNKKEMKTRKEKDLKIRKYRYINLRDQENGKFEGWYGDYAGVPFKQYRFLHDHVYECEVGFANKINKMGAPKRSGLIDSSGKPLDQDGRIERVHQMIPEYDD